MNTAPINSQNVARLVIIEISFDFSFLSGKVHNDATRAFEQAHIVVKLCSHVSIKSIN